MPETKKENKNLLDKLGEPLSVEAEQHTKKADTHKGYDTDGYGYQFCVDRFNEILAENWGFDWVILKEVEGHYKNGTPYYDVTAKVSIWINQKENIRSAVGGHIAVLYADALKGAITNAFKKTAAFWGVGRQAYQGMLDDDNRPLPKEESNGTGKKAAPSKERPPSPPQASGEYDKHATNDDAKDKNGKTLREHKNDLTIFPMYLAIKKNRNDKPLDELKSDAEAIYKLAYKFIPYLKPNSRQLELGRAWSAQITLERMVHDEKLHTSEARKWWGNLDSRYVKNYIWWDIDDEMPGVPVTDVSNNEDSPF